MRVGRKSEEVLTQALVRRCPAGGPQHQDHHQQPERSGLHGHGRAGSGDPSAQRCAASAKKTHLYRCVCTGTLASVCSGTALPSGSGRTCFPQRLRAVPRLGAGTPVHSVSLGGPEQCLVPERCSGWRGQAGMVGPAPQVCPGRPCSALVREPSRPGFCPIGPLTAM